MILLDTHVALWALHAVERIGPHARAEIESASSVLVSSITLAETSIKRMIGKLDVPSHLRRIFEEQGIRVLALTGEHAEAIERFPELSRHDPFDRLLLAQASVERCRLATADERLLAAGGDLVLDARR